MRNEMRRRRSAMWSLIATVVIGGIATSCPAAAQTIPPGQSCGGLVCDLGIFGHKSTPSEAPAASPAPPPPAAAHTAAVPLAPEPKPVKPRKARRVAKSVAPAAPAGAATPTETTAPVAPVAQAPKTASKAATVTPTATARAPAAAPPDNEVYIRANPYTTGVPSSTLILPIGPAPPPR